MQGLLSEETLLLRVKAHSTAGTDAVESDSVDMHQSGGWDGVMFFTTFGTANAANKIKARQSANDTDWADLDGVSVTVDTDRLSQQIDILRPEKRYVRAHATRTASSTLETIYALLYRPRKAPASALNIKRAVEPRE